MTTPVKVETLEEEDLEERKSEDSFKFDEKPFDQKTLNEVFRDAYSLMRLKRSFSKVHGATNENGE